MRSSPAIRSTMSGVPRRRAGALAIAGALTIAAALAGCGGKSKGPAPVGNGGGGPSGAGGGLAARLPWEAALTEGATFTLKNQVPDSDGEESVTVRVAGVREDGGARVYDLDWGEEGSNGPSMIRVAGTTVTIGDATAEQMQEPYTPPGGDIVCYGQDFSDPDGCADVCDASLCLSSAGIVSVDGLYAPDYGMFGQE